VARASLALSWIAESLSLPLAPTKYDGRSGHGEDELSCAAQGRATDGRGRIEPAAGLVVLVVDERIEPLPADRDRQWERDAGLCVAYIDRVPCRGGRVSCTERIAPEHRHDGPADGHERRIAAIEAGANVRRAPVAEAA
jgi:hypothetical protein